MFKIETFTEAHLSSVTNRTESHGDERVPAVSISLEMTCANTLLDAIDATLRDALYKAVEGQDQLPGVEPATPVLRSNSIDLVTLPTKHEGWRLTIDDGIDETDPMHFAGVKVDKLSVEPKQGGSVVLRFRCGTADVDAERLGKLAMHNGQSIWITLLPPEAKPDAIDGTQEAFDADHPDAGTLFAQAHGGELNDSDDAQAEIDALEGTEP